MTFIKQIFIALLTLLLPFTVSAATLSTPRTQTTLISEVKTIHAGEKFWVALHIALQPGWHTYWINPGDSGISPQLKWTLPNGFVAGPTQYIAPDRERVGPLVDYAYDGDAYYLVPITPPSPLRDGTTAILALKASWLVCKDICIPESGDFSLALPVSEKAEPGDDAAQMAALVGRLPMPVADAITFHNAGDEIRFTVPLKETGLLGDQIKGALFFPESEGLIANAAEQKARASREEMEIAIGQAEGKIADNASGVVSLYLQEGGRKDFSVRLQSEGAAKQVAALASQPVVKALPEPVHESLDIWTAIFYALVGGLILNAMPCVFPVLSLKALAVAKKAQARPAEARKQGLAYTAGVIASFLALAFALLVFQKGGQAAGWGYQMQSPAFVTFLALLLFLVSLNLAGYFELPVLFGNLGNESASKDNAWGSLLTGVLAVLVATPCTAPFMAPAIGFALTQNGAVIFCVFAALGCGLASPFLLISFYPRLIRALPKPGAWMITFKELLSFPMFGWTIWLLWLIGREAGAGSASIVLFSMLMIAFAIWLARHSPFVRFVGLLTGLAGVAVAAWAVHMTMMQVPPAHDDANHFSAARLEALRKEGKAVFVDATADWCLICKVNENVALSSPDVVKAFKDKNVAYLVADWTYGESEITHYLESFGRSGVPIYVYYAPGSSAPVVLPQVLTPSVVLEVLK